MLPSFAHLRVFCLNQFPQNSPLPLSQGGIPTATEVPEKSRARPGSEIGGKETVFFT